MAAQTFLQLEFDCWAQAGGLTMGYVEHDAGLCRELRRCVMKMHDINRNGNNNLFQRPTKHEQIHFR